jgi:hypothetical protein
LLDGLHAAGFSTVSHSHLGQTWTGAAGLVLENTGSDGIGLRVDTADQYGEWAISTEDKIQATNVTVQSLTLVGSAAGDELIEVGDVVAAAGLASPLAGQQTPLPRVERATAGSAGILGVVTGRLSYQPLPGSTDNAGNPVLELRSAAGAAKAGDYVAITVLGVAQVKADASAGAIRVGQRLTASDQAGKARSLRTQQGDGTAVSESAPVIGQALEGLGPGQDLIWVLVGIR